VLEVSGVSTGLERTQPTAEPTADVAVSDRVHHPGPVPDDAGAHGWRRVVSFALPVVLVCTFVVLGWNAERFRVGLGLLAPHVSTLLWGAVALCLGSLLVRRLLDWPVVPGKPRRFEFLFAPCALAGSVIAYLVELFGSWERGGTPLFTIGGIIPWSDAYEYFGGAQRLLFEGQLDAFNSRRPLHAAFLAAELAFTDLDLRKVLVIQALLLGVASYLAARAVARILGPVAGLALFAGIFGFARVAVYTVSTETMGVTLGALAFAALWQAVSRRNPWLVGGGMFVLALAFNFRPGPILVLLILPIAFALLLRGSRRLNWRVLVVSGAAVALAFSANYVVIYAFAGESANLNANANDVIYGMAKGVPGWSAERASWYAIYTDYPEIINMSDTERNRFVSARARRELRSHPGNFARSYAEGASNYFAHTGDYITAPVSSYRHAVYVIALALGAVVLITRWRASSRRVVLDAALFGGVVLALPALVGAWPFDDHAPYGWGNVDAGSFVPWWFGAAVGALAYVAFILIGTARLRVDRHLLLAAVTLATVAVMMPVLGTDTARSFSVAVPFLALAVALAVAVIERGLRNEPANLSATTPSGGSRAQAWLPVAAGAAVAAVAVIGAPIAAAAIAKPATPARTCPDGRLAEPLIGGAAVRLAPTEPAANELDELEVTRVTEAPTVKQMQRWGVFGPIHSNTTIVSGLTQRGHDRIAFVDGTANGSGQSVLYLCGATIKDKANRVVAQPEELDTFSGVPLDSFSTRP
jgi:hypothetical protein